MSSPHPTAPWPLASVSALSRTQLTLELAAALPPAPPPALLAPAQWTLRCISGLGHQPVVVELTPTGPLHLLLTVHPQITPGARYRVTAPQVPVDILPDTPEEHAATPEHDTFIVPTSFAAPYPPPHLTGRLPITAFLAPLGRQLQTLGGVGVSTLLHPWRPGDTRLVLASTLAFPESGAVFVGAHHLRYQARTTGSLEGITSRHFIPESLASGTLVTLDEQALTPQDRPPHLPSAADNAPPDWFRGDNYLEF